MTDTPGQPRGLPWRRKLLYAGLVQLVLLGAAELTLRGVDFQVTTRAELEATAGMAPYAYVERRDRQLGHWYQRQERSDDQLWVGSNPRLHERGFHKQTFPLDPGGELRLFAIGGSTTFGIPYQDQEWGFPQRMETLMRRRHPRLRIRVINAGVAGMDSGQFPRLVGEITRLNAHGLLIYSGNNEIRGTLLDACTDPYRHGLSRLLDGSRLVRLARAAAVALYEPPPLLAADTSEMQMDRCMKQQVAENRLLEQQLVGQESWFPAWPARTDAFYVGMLRRYKANLEQVLELALGARLKVFLAVPPANLHQEPQLALTRPGLGPQTVRQVKQLMVQVRQAIHLQQWGRAEPLLRRAVALAPTHAAVNYQLGVLALRRQQRALARRHLTLALDRDYLSMRPTTHVVALVRQICRDHPAVKCVDIHQRFDNSSPDLPGPNLFVDFCHPNIQHGVPLIAEEFMEAVERAFSLVAPPGSMPGQGP